MLADAGPTTVAAHRAQQGLPPLHTYVIDVISATSARLAPADAALLKHAKMSSTAIREWIVRTQPGAADGVAG